MVLPRLVTAAERAANGLVLDRLRGRGWQDAPVGYRGYASPSSARVLGRVLLTRPGAGGRQDVEDAARGHRGWRSFMTLEVPDVPVRVLLGDAVVDAVSDPGGYLDVAVPVALEPGWHDAQLEVPATGWTATAPVLAVGAGPRVGLVSDVDDTVLHSAVTQPLRALWNAVVLHEDARLAVPGIAEVYQRLLRAHPGSPVVYLSTGAWSTQGALRRFLARQGFPPGPLLLTDWGPSADRWFRDGRAHKRASLARLLAELPDVRWVLVGDSGQADREVYAEVAAAHPGRVALVVIREVVEGAAGPRRPVADGVVLVRTAEEAAAALEAAGVLPAPA